MEYITKVSRLFSTSGAFWVDKGNRKIGYQKTRIFSENSRIMVTDKEKTIGVSVSGYGYVMCGNVPQNWVDEVTRIYERKFGVKVGFVILEAQEKQKLFVQQKATELKKAIEDVQKTLDEDDPRLQIGARIRRGVESEVSAVVRADGKIVAVKYFSLKGISKGEEKQMDIAKYLATATLIK